MLNLLRLPNMNKLSDQNRQLEVDVAREAVENILLLANSRVELNNNIIGNPALFLLGSLYLSMFVIMTLGITVIVYGKTKEYLRNGKISRDGC